MKGDTYMPRYWRKEGGWAGVVTRMEERWRGQRTKGKGGRKKAERKEGREERR